MILIYKGPCELVDGKRGFAYVNEDTGTERVFSRAIGSGKKAEDIFCGRYEVEAIDEKTIKLPGRYLGQNRNHANFAQWEAEAIAIRAVFADRRGRASDANFSRLFKGLDPVRLAYTQAKGAGKRALILDVLKYIMQSDE